MNKFLMIILIAASVVMSESDIDTLTDHCGEKVPIYKHGEKLVFDYADSSKFKYLIKSCYFDTSSHVTFKNVDFVKLDDTNEK